MHETTTARLDLGGQVWHFTRHWLEMCVVMCVGGAILNGLLFLAGPALLGYPDLRQRSPVLAVAVSGLVYALPMAVWMRVRGMAWRPTLEMSGAVTALAVVMVGVAVAGVVSGSSVRGWAMGFCGPACGVMFVVMLFRLDLYTGQAGQPGRRRRPADRMDDERPAPPGHAAARRSSAGPAGVPDGSGP
jgi:hypothetical protein